MAIFLAFLLPFHIPLEFIICNVFYVLVSSHLLQYHSCPPSYCFCLCETIGFISTLSFNYFSFPFSLPPQPYTFFFSFLSLSIQILPFAFLALPLFLVFNTHWYTLPLFPRCSSQLFLYVREVRHRPRVERGRIWTHYSESGRSFLEDVLEHHWDRGAVGEYPADASFYRFGQMRS